MLWHTDLRTDENKLWLIYHLSEHSYPGFYCLNWSGKYKHLSWRNRSLSSFIVHKCQSHPAWLFFCSRVGVACTMTPHLVVHGHSTPMLHLRYSFRTQRMSWTNSSHRCPKTFLFLVPHSLSFLEELLQRPGLTHTAAGLSGFFRRWESCQALSALPPAHTKTHTRTHTNL